MSVKAVILAAGKGTRMKSEFVKVAHTVAGKPVVNYVIEAVLAASAKSVIVVVGHQAELVQELSSGYPNMSYVLQAEQLGTGHALMQVVPHLTDPNDTVVVLAGDCPLIKPDTLQALLAVHAQSHAAGTILTTEMADPASYGRILRDEAGHVLAIREAKDCTPDERAVREINTGIYCFSAGLLVDSLQKITTNNVQKEYYLTDVLEILRQAGHGVAAYCTPNSEQAIGINTRMDLAEINRVIYDQNNLHFMTEGVTLTDPATTFIDASVQIGRDTLIHPFCVIRGDTVIGSGCEIGPHAYLVDQSVPDGTVTR